MRQLRAGLAGLFVGNDRAAPLSPQRSRLSRVLRLEWLGQMGASLFWTSSVLAYGVRSSGDVLQLCAASAWAVANVAAVVSVETK